MIEGGFVADHLNEFNIITSQLSSVGINFDEKIRALLILCSLPESWNGLVIEMSNFVLKNHGKSRGNLKGRRSQLSWLNDYWYYGKPRHKKKDYWNWNKNEIDKPDGDKEANVVSNKSDEDVLLLSLESVDDSWVLDSNASFHAILHRVYFIDYLQGDFGLVYLGYNETY